MNTNAILEHLLPLPKGTPYPVTVIPQYCFPQTRQQILSLWICLFLTFHRNGIPQHVAFCSHRIMFSKFVHVNTHRFFVPFYGKYTAVWTYPILFTRSPTDRHGGGFPSFTIPHNAAVNCGVCTGVVWTRTAFVGRSQASAGFASLRGIRTSSHVPSPPAAPELIPFKL